MATAQSQDMAYRTIDQVLAGSPIGTVVAVRIVDAMVSDHGLLERRLARALDHAVRWMVEGPQRLMAQGSVESGQISVLLVSEGGRSALASVSLCGIGSPRLEIVVFGNRGILSWEPAEAGAFSSAAEAAASLDARAQQLLSAVRRSLTTGTCVTWGGGPDAGRPGAAVVDRPSRGMAVSEPIRPREPMRPPYGVLLVSGDHTHQPGYVEALASDPRVRLVGLADEADVPERRSELNARLARRVGTPVLPDLQAALRRPDVHVVSICAEPRRRGRIIVAAAEAGKHLFLDKPLCATLSDADRIVAAVRRAGVVAHMFSSVHFEPALRVREIVRSGTLGSLTAVHCDLCFAKGYGGTADLSKRRQETARPEIYEVVDAKREFTNIGVYSVALLLWALGRTVQRVFATTGNFFFAEHQARNMEDFGQAMIEFDGGLTATLSAGRAGWRSHPDAGLNRICLVGCKGVAVVDAHRPRVERWVDTAAWAPPPRDPEDPMGMWVAPPESPFRAAPKQAWALPYAASWNLDTRVFLDCIEQGRPSDMHVGLAAAATEVLLAAYESAATGRAVFLPLPREGAG